MKELIIKIIKRNKKEMIIKIITSLFVRGLLLVIPIYWSKTISYLTDKNMSKSMYLIVIVLILSILYYGWEYFNQRAWYSFYNKLYKEYTDAIVDDSKNINSITLAEFTNIINNDIDIICTFMGNSITRVIQVFEFLFIYSYFFAINKYIFIITIIISIIMVSLLLISGKTIQSLNVKRKNSLDKKTIMAHHIFDSKKSKDKNIAIANFNDSTNNYLNDNYNYNIITNGIIYIILACIEICRYGIILYSVYLVSLGKMELGTIVLIYTYYAKIITNFEMLGTISADYRSFIVSLKRLKKIKF